MVLQVVTSKLNAFVDESTPIFVESAGVYIQKPASQLEVGEHVVVERQYIDTSLERIDEILRSQRPAYQIAHCVVFDRDVPRLRAELWRAVLPPSTGLDAIIQRTSNLDFTEEEYSEAITRIQETGVTVKRDAIREWLSGETYAPMDWDNLAKLAQGLSSPALQQMYDSCAQGSGFFHEYKYYVTARSTLMHHIAEYSHSASSSVSLSSARPRRRFDAEISLVLQQLLADGKIIDETYQTARVMEVKKVGQAAARQSSSSRSGTSQHLSQGIATRTLPYGSLTLQEVIETVNILEAIVKDSLQFLLEGGTFFPATSLSRADGQFSSEIIPMATDYILARLIPDPYFQQSCDLLRVVGDSYEPLYKAFNDLISRGRVDIELGLAPGTFSKVLDALRTYLPLVPTKYKEIISIKKRYVSEHLVSGGERKSIRYLQSEVRLLGDALRAKGINPNQGALFHTYYLSSVQIHYGAKAATIDVLGLKEQAKREGTTFLTRQDVEARLDKIGVPRNAARHLHPNNFL
jgi:hypothetical protein